VTREYGVTPVAGDICTHDHVTRTYRFKQLRIRRLRVGRKNRIGRRHRDALRFLTPSDRRRQRYQQRAFNDRSHGDSSLLILVRWRTTATASSASSASAPAAGRSWLRQRHSDQLRSPALLPADDRHDKLPAAQ